MSQYKNFFRWNGHIESKLYNNFTGLYRLVLASNRIIVTDGIKLVISNE